MIRDVGTLTVRQTKEEKYDVLVSIKRDED
jgi:hypothetical protein